MGAVNENLATQVAVLVDILLETFTAHGVGTGEAGTTIQGLHRYTQQIERIATAAESGAFFGLHNVCMLYYEILEQLAAVTPISEQVRVLLEEWPTLVITYLELPDDPDTCAALAKHLGNPVWPGPVTADDIELLQALLAQPALSEDESHYEQLTIAEDDEEELVFAAAGGSEPTIFDFDITSEREPAVDEPEGYGALTTSDTTEQRPTETVVEPCPATPSYTADSDALSNNPRPQEGIDDESEAIATGTTATSCQDLAVSTPDFVIAAEHTPIQEEPGLEAVFSNDISEDAASVAVPEAVNLVVNELANETVDGTVTTTTDAAALEPVSQADALDTGTAELAEDDETLTDEAHAVDTAIVAPVPGFLECAAEASVEAPLEDETLTNTWATISSDAELETVVAKQDNAPMPSFSSTLAEQEAEAAPAVLLCEAQEETVGEDLDETGVDLLEESATWQDVHTVTLDGMFTGTQPEAASEPWEKNDTDSLDEATQELINILSLEVRQLTEALREALARTEGEDWRQVLSDHAEDVERFGEGATSVGLEGLQRISERIRAHLLHLVSQEQSLTAAQCQVINDWAAPVLGYLQKLSDPTRHDALVQYLQDPRWPHPLPKEDGVALRAALAVVNFDLMVEEQAPRQLRAEWQDVALTLPEDTNPELLNSLLQELPAQAADFSATIQRLTSGVGSMADVDTAQRIAHTLKGAASTVGVAGVVNLTHHLEDILLAFAKHEVLPTQAINDTLSSAADCLESMSETLIGVGDPVPAEDMLGVLQAVLDWANLIDHQGIPREDVQPQALVAQTEPTLLPYTAPAMPADASPPRPAAPAAPVTRLGTELVDELMRLAGEGMILNGQLQDRLQRTMQQMRTLRAQHNALRQLVSELEELVDIRGITSPYFQGTVPGEFDPLEMEQYNELHTVSRRLAEVATDAREIHQGVENHLTDLDGLLTDQHRVQQESEAVIMRTRMAPVKTIVPRLRRGIRQTCRLTGKEAELVLSGDETLMDSDILNSIVDPLMHILRNAVDHGIESPAEREQLGKARTGTITLEFARIGNAVVVRCRDDGAGLNYDAIRHTAQERGLIREQQNVSEAELGRLILRSGFSTRLMATQVSGRGIGMDAVYSRIQELKGSLHLSSETNKGCLIELRLPVSLLSTHGLLVRVGQQVMAVSHLGVEQLLAPGNGQVGQVGNKTTYQMGDEIFEAVTLEALLNLPSDQLHADLMLRPGLLVQEESGRRRIVLAQELLASQSLVVKNLGQYVPAISGLVGVTILGDGSAAPVLDLPELLSHTTPVSRNAAAPQASAPMATNQAPVALVVDDSLSARLAMAQFVKDLGFEVRTARDGLEAVSLIDHGVPDLLLVDLEMPRMNGLELSQHVRSRAAMAHVPIIMVTSRSTEKHRRSATEAGVDAYLVKPFVEDELAAHIQQLTTLRGVA